MALSGSIQNTFRTGYALRLEWSATQSIADNQSTVTAKLYWMSLGSYYTINSSATKTSGIQHDDGAWSTESSAGLADLNANQKKLINTYQFTLTHGSDGKKSFSLDAYFDCEVTIGSTYYSTVNIDQDTFTLDTIPRASSITSSASFTAGTDFTISVNRADNSFTHIARVYVDGTLIYTSPSKFGTSTKPSIDHAKVFTELAQRSSCDCEVEIDTYDGSTKIGSTASKSGTCTSPAASTITIPTSFNIGSSFTVTISRANSGFTHTIRIKNASGTVGKTYTGQGTSTTFATSDVTSTLYAWTPNSNSYTATMECITYYSGVQVRSSTSKTLSMKVTSSNPTFNNNWTFKDGATSVTSVTGQTGNSPTIVQKLSSVVVTITVANRAQAINGATMKNYKVTLNGVSKTATWSNTADVVFTYGSTAGSSSTQKLTVEAIDSRGNSTPYTKDVTVVPYSNPIITGSVLRTNGFETETTMNASGSLSPVTIGGVNKNYIKNLEYRYKLSTASWPAPEAWTPLTYTGTGIPSYTANTVVFATAIDQTKSYNFEIRVRDALGTTTPLPKTVPVGQPIMFLDATKKSVSVNTFPTGNGSLEIGMGTSSTAGVYLKGSAVQGKIWTGAGGVVLQSLGTANLHLGANNTSDITIQPDKIQVGAKTIVMPLNRYGSAGGAIDMNNSDMIGANCIWFADTMTGSGEALQFPKDSTPDGSFLASDYDSFRVYGGTGFLNDKPIFTSDSEVLYTSTGSYLNDAQSAPLSKAVSKCPNGIILVWSRYASGGQDDNWNYTYIPKYAVGLPNGIACPIWVSTNGYSIKYVYVSDTAVTGNAMNGTSPNTQACLRRILSY